MNEYEILLVEDNSSDVELACITLDELDLTNRTVIINNGEDALKYLKFIEEKLLKEEEVNLRMVILDIMLPKLNGFEILERIDAFKFKERIPIVIFSSSEICKDVYLAYSLGVNAYLVKPIDFNKHQYVLRSALNFWLNKYE